MTKQKTRTLCFEESKNSTPILLLPGGLAGAAGADRARPPISTLAPHSVMERRHQGRDAAETGVAETGVVCHYLQSFVNTSAVLAVFVLRCAHMRVGCRAAKEVID